MKNIQEISGNYYPYVNYHGKRIFAKKYYHVKGKISREDAIQLRNRLENELLGGTYSELSKTPLQDFIRGPFLKHYKIRVVANKIKPTYVYSMERRIELHIIPALGDRPIGTIKAIDCKNLQDDLLLSGQKSLYNIVTRDLMNILHKAESWDYISRAPKMEIESYVAETRPYISQEAIYEMLNTILEDSELTIKDFLVCGLASLNGLRRKELFSLKDSDFNGEWDFNLDKECNPDVRINYDTIKVHIQRQYLGSGRFIDPKTQSSNRVIPVHPFIMEQWINRMSDEKYINSEWLFPGRNPLLPQYHGTWNRERWPLVRMKCGLPDNFLLHDLRHSFRTALFANDCNERIINAIMGHAKGKDAPSTYTHINFEQMKRALSTLRPPESVEFDIEKEREHRANLRNTGS